MVHYADLPARDRDLVDGIPVTAVARTLLDLAALLSAERFDRVLERAEEREVLDLAAVNELLSRSTGHLGVGPLRRALAIYREEPAFVRSNLE